MCICNTLFSSPDKSLSRVKEYHEIYVDVHNIHIHFSNINKVSIQFITGMLSLSEITASKNNIRGKHTWVNNISNNNNIYKTSVKDN